MEHFGYDEFFESNYKKVHEDGDCFSVARVIAEYKGAYKVKNREGEYLAKVTGKRMHTALSKEAYPAVGDWAVLTILDKENAVIHEILPRRTILKRKYNNKNEAQIIAANVDVAFIVESIDRDFSVNRFERYVAIAKDGGVHSAIILNKTDLLSKDDLDIKVKQIRDRFKDTDILTTSTISNTGSVELLSYIIEGKTYSFLGSSGVGKSSLINTLLGENALETGDIGLQSKRGKHVTTKREMYFLKNGGIVIDNPGTREVGMTDTDTGVNALFDEIVTLAEKCKYPDCTHTHEPECNVRPFIQSGKIDVGAFSNYVTLKKEAEFYEMSKLKKRGKDKKFGKFLKKAKKKLGDCGYDEYHTK
jgi:ribosome biogenesis GTPase